MSNATGGLFEERASKEEIERIQRAIGEADFWVDRDAALKTVRRLKELKRQYDPWQALYSEIRDLQALHSLAAEEQDESISDEVATTLERLRQEYERLLIRELLGEERDSASAFLTIHSGAGGVEACDWVSMLLRMYVRWATRHNFSYTTIDMQESEGGIKSVTVEVSGDYVYGYLKCEAGVHRLVRISPFDSGARRHTSFASVAVSPVVDDSIDIDIQPSDIRVDTYRASGAGGQHVNKTDSAVRITHLESGIVAQCQNERSQHKNRAIAMRALRSRLYQHLRNIQEEEIQKKAGVKKSIAWGNQIRSYVFQPYTMVKDHRTNYESGNIQAIMDGAIDRYIDTYLRWLFESRAK